ncbi:MAG: diacylglycerol kinase family lipid kinase [Chloroflexi bacterium]|nr:diacylglycerol kinase family lipid kinase [Chloroflexota bacterium]
MAKTLVIVNPIAGRGYGERGEERVKSTLRAKGVDFDVAHTERPMHAADLAEEGLKNGYQTIVAVGGDGTSNEVINGMMRCRHPGETVGTMAAIPIGSGNDFAWGAGIPLDLEAACDAVAQGRSRVIDVGVVDGRYFGNGVGVGFDGMVTILAQKIRFLTGLPLYLVAVLQTTFIYFKAPLITMQYDEQTITAKLLMISIANGRRYGGGFLVTPEAQMDDGLFDLCIAREVSQFNILRLIPHFIKGTHTTQPNVTMARARRVVLTTDAPQGMCAHADGEVCATDAKRMELEIIPQALRVVVGEW